MTVKLGDKVKVTNTNYNYSTYREFFRDNGFFDHNYMEHTTPSKDCEFTVAFLGKHRILDDIIAILETEDGEHYLVGIEGLEVIRNVERHKHADLIHEWAEGVQIEYYNEHRGVWRSATTPSWGEGVKYRIKPKKSKKELEIESIKKQMVDLQNHLGELQYRLDDLQGKLYY